MSLPSLHIKSDRDQAETLLGVLDCLFAFGVGLANRGYIDLEELAEIFEDVQKQHQANPDAQHPARQYPAKMFAQLFRAQVVSQTS